MRIDKEKLKELASLPDDELWARVVELAGGYGFTLPKQTPPHSELEKLRSAVSPDGKPSLGEALRLLNEYRRRKQ